METFAMFTASSNNAAASRGALHELEQRARATVLHEAPEVEWIESFTVSESSMLLGVFKAPDIHVARRVALAFCAFGHNTAEVWCLSELSLTDAVALKLDGRELIVLE